MNIFADITAKQSRGVIIHHWDTDGMASAALLLNYFEQNFPTKKVELYVPTITNYYLTPEQIEYLEQQNYDFIITCDINFPAETVDQLAQLAPKQVYVFDHHHQTPYPNVHYYNEPKPACAAFITEALELPNNMLAAIALVGDKEEAIQQDVEYYPKVQAMMGEYNITFTQLLQLRRLLDSNYIVDDYEGMAEAIDLLRHDPVAVLTDVRLLDNVKKIDVTMNQVSTLQPERLSDLVYYVRVDTSYNILSHLTRNLSRQYADKIIFTRQLKGEQVTCYIRRRSLNYDMRQMIAFARNLGLNAGGKEDVVGIIIPQVRVDEFFPEIVAQLKAIQL